MHGCAGVCMGGQGYLLTFQLHPKRRSLNAKRHPTHEKRRRGDRAQRRAPCTQQRSSAVNYEPASSEFRIIVLFTPKTHSLPQTKRSKWAHSATQRRVSTAVGVRLLAHQWRWRHAVELQTVWRTALVKKQTRNGFALSASPKAENTVVFEKP